MSRNVRTLLARLEAAAANSAPDLEREEELERSTREMLDRMEANSSGRLALEVLDKIGKHHDIEADDRSGELVRSALGYEAGIVALDLVGWFLEPPESCREPPVEDEQLMRRFVDDEDKDNKEGAT